MQHNTEELKRCAVDAAKVAGEVHRHYAEIGFTVRTKSARNDRVTEADTQSESAIVDLIRSRFPSHDFVGEEDTYAQTGSRYVWVIDPLDGTTNYTRGLPLYSVSIALFYDGRPILGVVHAQAMGETYLAMKGEGATLNGRPIAVSPVDSLKDALFITGFHYKRGDKMRRNLAAMERLYDAGIIGMRRLGSAALDCCYVARGIADGFWEEGLNAYDFAAGALIAEEAGGRASQPDGSPLGLDPAFVVVTNGTLHATILAELNRSQVV